MKAKITKVEYVKEWGTGLHKIHYHNVWFDGSDKKWNIGAKVANPDFLTVGEYLQYEIVDEAKNKIKRVPAAAMSNQAVGGGKKPSFTKKTTPTVNANSTSLIRHLDNFNESDLIFIDIETVRSVKELKEGTPLHDAWLYKTRYNNELERKSGETVTPEAYFDEKAALYAPFAKVVTIVVGRIVGDELKTKSYAVSKKDKWDEAVPLRQFNDDVNTVLDKNPNSVFVGWANIGFDQPFLMKRMIVHGIQPNLLLDTAHLKPWEVPGFDLKEMWKGTSFYPDSLISVAVALGLPSPKTKMDGAEVGEAFYKGKIDDIVEYCTGDVLTSANVYRKFVNKPLLTLR